MKTTQKIISQLSLEGRFDSVAGPLFRAGSFLLASPKNPDVDSCMSVIAFREFLRWYAKRIEREVQITLFAPNAPVPNSLFDTVETLGNPCMMFETVLPDDKIYDLCVTFDYGSFRQVGVDKDRAKFFIGFDHHPGDSGFPENGLEIKNEHACSTTALLASFFAFWKFPLSGDVATALFAGIVADTGRFSHLVHDAEPFAIAADLARRGARVKEVFTASVGTYSFDRLAVHYEILRNRTVFDSRIGLLFYSFSCQDLKRWRATEKDALSFLGVLEKVKEARLVMVCYEEEGGTWRCSLRSRDGVSARKVATRLGGGGHDDKAAASGRNPDVAYAVASEFLYSLQSGENTAG